MAVPRLAVRMAVAKRAYRPGVAKLPRLDKPMSMDTTMGELFDAVWTKWTYRRAWLLVPFAYVASSIFSAAPMSEDKKAMMRARDDKLKALEFHQD